MGWVGLPVTPVTSADIRQSLKVLATELGLVATCPCGSSRWCTGQHLDADFNQFLQLHARHQPKR